MINLKTGKQFNAPPCESLPRTATEESAGHILTRREFGKGLAAIIGAGVAPSIALGTVSLAGSANASVGRGMMRNVGARQAAMCFDSKEEIQYLPDGTVANDIIGYWLPIYNAGWKYRDSTIRCVDLIDNCGIIKNFSSIGDSYARFNRNTNVTIPDASKIVSAWNSGGITIEFVFASGYSAPSTSQWAAFMSNDLSGVYFRTRASTTSIQAIPGFNTNITRLPVNRFSYSLDKNGSVEMIIDKNTKYTSIQALPLSLSSSTFRFGASSSSANTNTLIGDVYAIRIYGRVLTDEMMSINYEVDLKRFGV